MTAPSNITVEVEFTPGAWTDISSFVTAFDTDRGRSFELDAIEAGVCNVTFDNSDGRFTPGLARINADTVPGRINLETHPIADSTGQYNASTNGWGTPAAAATNLTTGGPDGGLFRRFTAGVAHTPGSTGVLVIQQLSNIVTGVSGSTIATPGTSYALSMYVRCSIAQTISLFGAWLDSAGAGVGTAAQSANVTLVPNTWTLVSVGGVAPVGAAVLRADIRAGTTGTPIAFAIGDTLDLANVLIESGTTTPGAFFDGNSTGCSWSGTANASTSVAPAGVPAPYYPNVLPRKRLRVKAAGTGSLAPVFQGRIEKWPVVINDGMSTVQTPVIDSFSNLANVNVKTWVKQVMMTSFAPDHYWPMDEGTGATQIANLINANYPGQMQKKGSGAYTTGNPSQLKTGDDGTGASIAVTGSGRDGAAMEVLLSGSGSTLGATGFSFAMIVNINNNNETDLFAMFGDDGRLLGRFWYDSVLGELHFTDWNGASHQSSIGMGIAIGVPTVVGFKVIPQGITTSIYLYSSTAGLAYGPNPLSSAWTTVGTFPTGAIVGAVYVGGQVGSHGTNLDNQSLTMSQAALWLNGAPAAGATAWPDPWAVLQAGLLGTPSAGVDVASILGLLAQIGLGPSTTITTLGAAETRQMKMPDWTDGDNVLETAQGYATEVSGIFVMGPDDTPRLVTHDYLSSGVSAQTFSDSTGSAIEPGVEFDMDADHLANIVTVVNTNGATQVLRDSVSQAAYGDVSPPENLVSHFVSDADAFGFAQWYLHQYSQPIIRLSECQLLVSANSVNFDTLLTLDIGSRITIGDLPAQAPYTTGDFVIERVQHSVTVDGETYNWQTVFDLSPAPLWDVWILEDAARGLLDSTTVLSL